MIKKISLVLACLSLFICSNSLVANASVNNYSKNINLRESSQTYKGIPKDVMPVFSNLLWYDNNHNTLDNIIGYIDPYDDVTVLDGAHKYYSKQANIWDYRIRFYDTSSKTYKVGYADSSWIKLVK